MKKTLALMFTVVGIAATLVPTAGAKPGQAPDGGGASGNKICICMPVYAI